MHRATVGILQHPNILGDPRRQSSKSLRNLSQVDGRMNYFEHHQNHVGSPIDVLTSEETSDTNVDDHLEVGGGR
jgi:hypothetical protein